jgi:ABC-type polysaccharide/polyol phosphate transport system ATPase subunit
VSEIYRIRLEGVCQEFSLGGHTTIKDLFTRTGGSRKKHNALDNLTLRVNKNESVAILGHNGAGKSTLLKIIAGVLAPTSGEVYVNGSLIPLLQLGAGFHPELNGYENIELNASLLGIEGKALKNLVPRIIEFAELDRFMDTPIKFYSSGMIARLGFSIAININPDIVLLDEILAVGDINFQQKSYEAMRQLRKCGKSLITVTHAISGIEDFADRVVVMQKGRVIFDGDVDEGVAFYRNSMKF